MQKTFLFPAFESSQLLSRRAVRYNMKEELSSQIQVCQGLQHIKAAILAS